MNFFKVTCPFLYELETVAYFAIIRNAHTYHTIAGIRETTQLLLDIYTVEDEVYVHPLKVWQRYSPTMFFTHHLKENQAVPITASAKAAELFSNLNWEGERVDFWHSTIAKAKHKLDAPLEEQENMKERLLGRLVGKVWVCFWQDEWLPGKKKINSILNPGLNLMTLFIWGQMYITLMW